jgi:hypothetical protein
MDWIPVTDRLPPVGLNVLACSWLAKTYALAYVSLRDGKWYVSFGSTRSLNITHWMPLPDLPQEGTVSEIVGKPSSSEYPQVYTVYQTDPLTRVKEQVGWVLERRKLDRGNNFEGLMKVAQKLYPAPSPETVISLE